MDSYQTTKDRQSFLRFSLDSPYSEEVSTSTTSSARCGTLHIRGRESLETPNFYATTSRGVVPHLTPDVLAQQESIGGVHMALEDFVERAAKGKPPVLSCPPGRNKSRLHTFTCLPSNVATILAPRRTPPVVAPVGNSNSAISIFTSVGFYHLTSKAYADYVSALSPDIAISMPDIPFTSPLSNKRVSKMGGRTQKWLMELLACREGDETEKLPAIFAPVLPIPYNDQAEYLEYVAYEILGPRSVEGFAFYDVNLIADMPATTALNGLPRLSLDSPSTPHQLLRQVSLGVDLFTLPFVAFATDAGLALTFEFPQMSKEAQQDVRPLAVNLFSPALAKDLGPLTKSCSCYTCTTHHCAFITHLLAAKEMLGWVLLQIHNHHITSVFLDSVRSSIKSGDFQALKGSFEKNFEPELPQGTGEKPRVRGYHFKAEGPGEPKRNKAAWGILGKGSEQKVESSVENVIEELKETGVAEVIN